jgi:hypothetical protein
MNVEIGNVAARNSLSGNICFQIFRYSKFRGLVVSRKEELYFISVSSILKHCYPLPPFGFGSIYLWANYSSYKHAHFKAIPPVSPSRW